MERILGPTNDPEMADLVNKVKADIGYNLNCVQVGTIEVYNQLNNTASVSINYKRKLANGDVLAYPLLVDCPVFILSGGESYVSMPVARGDQCIILFNDRDLDNWWYSGAVDVPASPRCHNISDAMALVGVRNLTTAEATSTTAVLINTGPKFFAVKNDLTSLKILVDLTIDTMLALTVGPGSTPLSAASIAALTALKVQWALLVSEGIP